MAGRADCEWSKGVRLRALKKAVTSIAWQWRYGTNKPRAGGFFALGEVRT